MYFGNQVQKLNILVGKNLSNKKRIDLLVSIIKISIIIFSAYAVIANFIPFFENGNPYYYGINAMLFGNGQFSITNEFLQETRHVEFIPENWIITDHGTAVPISGSGLMVAGSIFYLIGGYYGLFYLSPICYIILLIASERISTKLFGSYVGFFTLLVVASSNLLFRNSIELQTESIFALFFIVGVFYLIKFIKTKKNHFLLISTIVFTVSTWIRINGLITFPLEIFIISTYVIFTIVFKKKSLVNNINSKIKSSSLNFKKLTAKKIIIICLIIAIPWLIFLISHLTYYENNFGDPLSNYGDHTESMQGYYDTSISGILKFEQKDFENIKQFSKYLLPYQIPAIYNSSSENYDEILGNNWIGFISLILLLVITGIAFFTKDKRLEIFVLIVFVVGTVWFFSSITSESRAEYGVPGRYMLPAFVLSSMIFGYFIQKIIRKQIVTQKLLFKILKIGLIITLGIFFILAFYFSNPIQIIFEEDWNFKNPEKVIERYPLDLEGLNKESIIVTIIGPRAIEYGFIPFDPTSTKLSSNSINLLRELIKDGHDVNIFKIPFTINEKEMISKLTSQHNFILKDHSKTFCKIELPTNEEHISDENCINNQPVR